MIDLNISGKAGSSMRGKRWIAIFMVLVFLCGVAATGMGAAPQGAGEKVEVLIGFHGLPDRGIVEVFGGEVYREFTIVDVIAARVPQQAVVALEKNPLVRYVEPDGVVYAVGQTVPWGIDRVFGDEKHPFGTWISSTGSGVKVAVLDTGIAEHKDLMNNIQGYNAFTDKEEGFSDGHSHGTHVAGTIAALDNAWGVVGVAPEVDLYAVKVLDDSGSGTWSSIVAGIEWAVSKDIPVINMSLGGSTSSTTLKDACDTAYNNGVLLVAAAGNETWLLNRTNNVIYPAKYDSVIAVSASDSNDNRASFSSNGPEVELIAPGVSINSTVLNNNYGTKSGTSMASPHVAGVAALVWGADTSLKNTNIRTILQDTAQNLGISPNHQGYGLVRADLAVRAVGDVDPPPPPEDYDLTVSSTAGGSVTDPGEDTFTFEEGTVVNLVATADSGYQFVNWTGNTGTITDVNAASTTITMNGNYTISANFEEKPAVTYHDLTTSSTGGGSATTPGEGTFTYKEGTVVDLVAEADSSYQFINWTGDTGTIANVNAASTTITMNGDYSISANFKTAPETEGPKIIHFNVNNTSNPAWARATVDWTVSFGTNSATVKTDMLLNGTVVATQTSTVSGSTASGTHELRHRSSGNTYTIRLTVTDTNDESSFDEEVVLLEI